MLLICGIVSCTKDNDTTPEDENLVTTSPEEALITSEILKLVNEYRAEKKLAALASNEIADQLAIEHTLYMIAQKKISHDGFSERGDELRAQVNASGFAENVASHYRDAASVVNAWIESDGHRENLEGNYTHIGIAAIKDDDGNYYYTQLFYL
ncbi:CAP domain-containing protein [Aquimarina sp. 2201CG1-2-11]|uniref:CAP domain-containing protein n=1 Tax=Aquimarina discodermiae TaxID=3231043 RepID=UPI003462844C